MKTDDTLHIKNFIEAINRADNTRQKNISFDIEQAKRIRNALSVLLLRLVDKESNQTTTSIQMDGGDFK
jgi:hypothetical protein|tara:strand:+ start:7471 stop:7677 length:207 start_codon:yes stop_codon:yes gene_type:complete